MVALAAEKKVHSIPRILKAAHHHHHHNTMTSDNNKIYPSHLKIVSLISILHISVGLLFWIWSISLWARGEYDSGIVLFLFPIATGLMGLRIVYLCSYCQTTNNQNNQDDQEALTTSTDQPSIISSDTKCCCCNFNNQQQQQTPPTKCWFILLLFTHLLTTAVYAYAGARGIQEFDKSQGYQLYCQIAAVCWAVSGVIIVVLACRFRTKFEVCSSVGGGIGGR